MFDENWKNIALSSAIILFGILYLIFWSFFARWMLGFAIIFVGILGLWITLKEYMAMKEEGRAEPEEVEEEEIETVKPKKRVKRTKKP